MLLLVSLCCFGFVDLRFERCWSRCPLIIGAECGGCRLTCADVMFGKVVRRLASMAVHQVDRAGEKREAWMKAMRSAMVSVGKMELAVWCSSVTVVSGSELGKSSCQRREPVSGERVPDMMGGPVRVMASCVVSKTSTLVELKMAVQPWSQSWPMEISEPEARAGKM